MSGFVRAYIYVDRTGQPRLRKLRRREPLPEGKRKCIMQSLVNDQNGELAWAPRITEEHREFADRALYHLDEVYWALKAGEPVFWTEGEKDADAMRALGVVATSHWQGATKSRPEQALTFVNGPRSPVYLVADVNLAGAACVIARQKLLWDMGVGNDRITLLAPPIPYVDAAEAIAEGAGLDDFAMGPRRLARCERVAEIYLAKRKAERGDSDWMHK